MNKTVMPIHFEDYSGKEFERLCFAYLIRSKNWKEINWYGQLGNDRGRDIYGFIEEDDLKHDKLIIYQCANHQKLSFKKIKDDIIKIINGPKKKPDTIIIISGGAVSSKLKDDINSFSNKHEIYSCETWSGTEFEERLRKDTPDLLKRFIDGIEFPELKEDIIKFALLNLTDEQVISQYSLCFDRPAFKMPFHQESSLPAFKKAITDTIEALNTGIYRLRDGTIIKRITPYHEIKSDNVRNKIKEIINQLEDLRYKYDELCQNDKIRHCACKDIDCPVHLIDPDACKLMDKIRANILINYSSINKNFDYKIARYI